MMILQMTKEEEEEPCETMAQHQVGLQRTKGAKSRGMMTVLGQTTDK